MPQERVCRRIERCDAVVVAVEVFELRVVRKVDGRERIVVDVQLHELGILRDIQLREFVLPRVDPLAGPQIAHIQTLDRVVLHAEDPERGITRDVERLDCIVIEIHEKQIRSSAPPRPQFRK